MQPETCLEEASKKPYNVNLRKEKEEEESETKAFIRYELPVRRQQSPNGHPMAHAWPQQYVSFGEAASHAKGLLSLCFGWPKSQASAFLWRK